MLFHGDGAELLSAMRPAAEKTKDRQRITSTTGTFEPGTVIPSGRQFGAIVAYRDGRGVVLYDGKLRWGEWLESRTSVKILLLDDAGPNQQLQYVDESGNCFSSWLVAQRRARRRKLGHFSNLSSSRSNRLPLRLWLRRILA